MVGATKDWQRWRGLRASLLGPVCVILLSLGIPSVAAQSDDVVDLLMEQRAQARANEILAEIGMVAPPRGHINMMGQRNLYMLWIQRNLAARTAREDSVRHAEEALAAAVQDSIAIEVPLEVTWRKYAADEQGDFLNLYQESFWRAVGTPHPLDTLSTPAVRGKLNGLFGAPTRNAAALEQEGYAGSEYVQFEYWLEVNNEIPVLVMDTDGPFGRGVMLAIDEAYVEFFADIKRDLFDKLTEADPVPYADYVLSHVRGQWYRTGFDGEEYFTRTTRRPRWARNRPRDEKWRIFR